MKLVVQVRLLPTPEQAAALEATLTACNEAATWAASVAFEEGARKNLALRKLAYQDIKTRWGLGHRPPSTRSRRPATPTPP
ncbi:MULTISPECIES: hypothetical protein [unclassified Streptomyces]|uniref:helix-turn-helix domain-containing protein n=1 Tax=unclassified Streptomyces TaxID=2593676 RepID=UPI002B1CD9F0|nr:MULTISPECIES: hypothetical protein [unclassified Streptomyces]